MASKIAPFIFPTLPSTWFIGHMSRALREMQSLIQSQSVDLIIETRDSRLPLSSINPAFEKILYAGTGGELRGVRGTAKRLIVYNKRDLGQGKFEEPLKKALSLHTSDPILFTDSRSDSDIRILLKTAIKLANRELEGPEDRITLLVAGMPNVGKSSLLNALRRVGVRKGKAASVSSSPGHTRRLSTVIKISLSPPIYVADTPGIMVPFLGKGTRGNEVALKLALTGGIKESLFEGSTVVEYLIWRLRGRVERGEDGYSEEELFKSLSLSSNTPLDPPHLFLEALAKRLSAVQKGGILDVDFAGRWLIQSFREGKLGRWTLDGLGRGGEVVDYELESLSSGEDVEMRIPKLEEEEGVEREKERTEEGVIKSVNDFVSSQSVTGSESLSGHQVKKKEKAQQAVLREVKRKEREVLKGVVGGKTGGPSQKLFSARRRNYRR